MLEITRMPTGGFFMKNGINKYFRLISGLFIIMSISYIFVFFIYLKFDLAMSNSVLQMFFLKYSWIYLFLMVLFLFFINYIMAKTEEPIKEITRIIQNIFGRIFSKNMYQSNKDISELHLAVAMNQLAERIEKQLELIEQNDLRLHGILENMSSGVILVAKDRKIVLVNPAAEELLEYSKLDLIGKRHVEATRHPEISDSIEECFWTREKIKRDIVLYYPREKTLQINFIPMKNENNEILGVVVILNDLTDIRKLEQIRTDFVANVSHELKTPITSIRGFTETLLDGAYEDVETSLNFLNIIKSESDRLLQIVNDLLELSKIESNTFSLNMEDFNLNNLVELIRQTLETKINQHELHLDIQIDNDLHIYADKSKVSQILLNLINNAIMYTPIGGKICVGARMTDDFFEIAVEDNGIGIAKENLTRIFERFYRVDRSRSRNKGGTGLGLAIVKHLVESHHGTISVKSKVGEGTKFNIQLPKKS